MTHLAGHPTHPAPAVYSRLGNMMIMIAFITTNSGLVPLIEGLCAQILCFCGFEHQSQKQRSTRPGHGDHIEMP